ncbi:outer membrane lipoprotein-sorting protein [Phragmitibacter flavus]|uniref:Outer membrane lipoprotein-sorting protein n=1 Tax=Phragmitibacter flavus TaxID=2576071 RepID=A0A5R8KJP8_9BACT|nr:outer membrane lipoprotein-sorting protein [Phragmitibacter flavus]TLD72480.1 outer membrane lipoprotein-sorting protein [Phragmitibacter flavus]
MFSSICLSVSLKQRFAAGLGFVVLFLLGGGMAGAQEPFPDGNKVLEMVRMSQAMQELPKLTGRLRNDVPDDGVKHPFELTMAGGKILFSFKNPVEVIELDLAAGGTKLNRSVGGKNAAVAEGAYGTPVRGTSVNYEDLSMRFLYWPGAKVMGSATVSSMNCWVVRVVNPDRRGPYHTVDVWVHKDSGAIAKMEAHDRSAKKVKSFSVKKGQRYKKAWILKQMQVESHDPASGKVNGRTYMDIDDPK